MPDSIQKPRRINFMNKGVLFLLSMVLSSLLLFFAACQPVETPPESVTHTYLGAGSYGDVITYELTHTTPTSGTFSYYNETKDQRGTGTFTELTDPRYKGILEAMLDGDDVSKYYCIEIPDRLMITSVPSGNDNNRLIFAITNEQDIGPSDCVDDYMWIYYYDGIAPDAFDYETKYGGFSLTDEPYNGKYKYYYGAAPAGVNPEDFPEAFYPEYFTGTAPWDVDVGGIGEWYIAGKRLKYKETEGISPNQGVELTGLRGHGVHRRVRIPHGGTPEPGADRRRIQVRLRHFRSGANRLLRHVPDTGLRRRHCLQPRRRSQSA
jgi:hypothetical protein